MGKEDKGVICELQIFISFRIYEFPLIFCFLCKYEF